MTKYYSIKSSNLCSTLPLSARTASSDRSVNPVWKLGSRGSGFENYWVRGL